jgi:uncharacterized protein YgbK (DUF1537 family)
MISYTETIKSLPPLFPEKLTGKNRKSFLDSGLSVIVLDDDPTGTQTISEVPILTTWDQKEIEKELKDRIPLFFILTNSRSLVNDNANRLATEIGKNIRNASEKTNRRTLVISRGDSTLRGHYPNEVHALGDGLGLSNAAHIIIPAFFQGGRYTIDDVHYVREGEHLIPAGETPYARDSSFGYQSSNLKDYVEEKSGGRIKAKDVVSISLDDLREKGPEKVTTVLEKLHEGQVCIVNAAEQSDLDVFAAGFFAAYRKGMNPALFRTAASVVPSLAGLQIKLPLEKDQIKTEGKGGIVAVGSYVPKTSKQLDYLKQHFPVEYIEIKAKKLLDASGFPEETARASARINANLKNDRVVVIYTSREVIKGSTAEESLRIVNRISSGMVETVKGIQIRPRFFIAKGGITSSDILTKSFSVKKAWVLGQIIPGVPVWRLSDCNAFPGLIYMPFPGNLGGDDAILKAIYKFTNS